MVHDYFSLSSNFHEAERFFPDVSHPHSFNETTASMPLMHADDYFVRQGTLSWSGGPVTLNVSAEPFYVYCASF